MSYELVIFSPNKAQNPELPLRVMRSFVTKGGGKKSSHNLLIILNSYLFHSNLCK